MDNVFVIFDNKDKKNVEEHIAKRAGESNFIYDDISNAQSVIYFESAAAEKNPECRKNLQYAFDNNLTVQSIRLGGGFGTAIAAIFLLGFLAVVFYLVAFQYVPNVIGSDVNQAISALETKKFASKIEYDYSDAYPAGLVMDQNFKEKFMPFLPVTITVSLGQNDSLKELPDVSGLSVSEGVQKLFESGFEFCRITTEKDDPGTTGEGIILSQFLPGGCSVSSQVPIEISIAAGESEQSFEVNGNRIVLPTEAGVSFDISFSDGATKTEKVYAPKSYDNAEYLYGKVGGEFLDIHNSVYDKPVVINGDNNAVILFSGTVFNDDIILQTGGNAVFVYMGGDCELNGNIYIENNAVQSSEDDFVTTLFLGPAHPVEILHGSGVIISENIEEKITVNGEIYQYDESLTRKDFSAMSELYPKNVFCSEDETPNVHVVSHYWQNGELITKNQISWLNLQ